MHVPHVVQYVEYHRAADNGISSEPDIYVTLPSKGR